MANSNDHLPVTREQIDAATQELRSLTTGRHRAVFMTAKALVGLGLPRDEVRAELMSVVGREPKMRKKVAEALMSLDGANYRWVWRRSLHQAA